MTLTHIYYKKKKIIVKSLIFDFRCWMFDVGCLMFDVRCSILEYMKEKSNTVARAKNFSPLFFFILVVAEGYSVLSIELSISQLTGIFYGLTLIGWTSVIAIVMFGLAAGYFFSSYFLNRIKESSFLFFWILGISFSWIWLIPRMGFPLMNFFYDWGLITGVVLSSFILVFPSVFLLSMIPPILSGINTFEINKSGKSTGVIFALSTLSGIAGIFMNGFWFIPEYGLTISFVITGAVIFLLWVIIIIKIWKSDTEFLLP